MTPISESVIESYTKVNKVLSQMPVKSVTTPYRRGVCWGFTAPDPSRRAHIMETAVLSLLPRSVASRRTTAIITYQEALCDTYGNPDICVCVGADTETLGRELIEVGNSCFSKPLYCVETQST